MRRKVLFTVAWIISAVVLGLGSAGSARSQITQSAGISQTEIDRIVRTFTAKESQFRSALNTYAFKRDAIVQSLGMGGQITGEYHRVSYFTFDDSGNRYEKIAFFPM